MLLKRSSVNHLLTACVVLVVCTCIFMQMLGTTMTLWDLEFELDPDNAVLLEGFSVPASCLSIPPPAVLDFLSAPTTRWRHIVCGQTLFRPPNFRI
ncbi:MAG TPA: hypothetical protein VKP13_05655 [Nitrospira sp.]|nr:hypothetical protein [Nitrospira sp.]